MRPDFCPVCSFVAYFRLPRWDGFTTASLQTGIGSKTARESVQRLSVRVRDGSSRSPWLLCKKRNFAKKRERFAKLLLYANPWRIGECGRRTASLQVCRYRRGRLVGSREPFASRHDGTGSRPLPWRRVCSRSPGPVCRKRNFAKKRERFAKLLIYANPWCIGECVRKTASLQVCRYRRGRLVGSREPFTSRQDRLVNSFSSAITTATLLVHTLPGWSYEKRPRFFLSGFALSSRIACYR